MATKQRLSMRLDFRSGLPAYLQIVKQVERQAATGRLQPGAQLPTVRRLAAQLGVNFNTAARAYRLLNKAGVVSTQRGRGTYILTRTASAALGRSRRETLEWLASRFIAEAKGYEFSEAEIAQVLRSRLGRERQGS